MPIRPVLALAASLMLLMLLASAAMCGDGDRPSVGVTVEPITATASAPSVRIGGKPAAPVRAQAIGATPRPSSASDITVTPDGGGADEADVAGDGGERAGRTAEGTPTPYAADGSSAPSEGRWIDVDVRAFRVRLMDGASVVREIAPVAVGVEVDTGAFASTQTGLFHVYNKVEDLAYDPPYDTWISHWVGFDAERQNGFHSFLKDQEGKVVDAATGRVSNGCIRTGDAEAVYAFAEIGMPVWVHW